MKEKKKNIQEQLNKDKKDLMIPRISRINKKTAKDIVNGLSDSIMDAVLQILIKKEPKISKLFTIPEVKNLILTKTVCEWEGIRLSFELSDFTGDLRKILLNNGYTKNNTVREKDGVTIKLYWSKVIIGIKEVDKEKSVI